MPKKDAVPHELEALAREVRSAVDAVLADGARRDWNGASRRVLALLHATRRLETEIDFHYMSTWLERAKAEAWQQPVSTPPARKRASGSKAGRRSGRS